MEFKRLAQIIGNVMNLNPNEIQPDMALIEDLGADSLDVYQIMIDLEEEMQCEFDSDKAEKLKTVGDILKLVESVSS